MRKITYYENILEFKENTKERLNLNDINNWQLCRTCLTDTDEEDVDIEKMSVIDVMQGSFLSIKEMLIKTTNITYTSTENLPLKVCKECLNKIAAFYYFSLQVRQADKVVNRLANKLKDYQDMLEVCKSEANFIQEEMPEECVILQLEEEAFDNFQDSNSFEHKFNISLDENNDFAELLDKPADIEETSEWFEEVSESEPALIKDEEYYTNLKSEFLDEEYHLDDDSINDLEISDADGQDTFKNFSTVTTTNTITTEKVKYEVKRVKRFSNAVPTSGYRHKQPRVSSPLLTNFTCAICQDSFGRQHDLVHHVRKSHPNSKAYRCRVCDNLFSHIQSLSRHMNSHKEAVVMNKCDFCDKTFVRVDDLKRHLRVHTGERPYVCSICDKSFQQQFACKNHQEKHFYSNKNGNKNLQPRKFICTHCEQTYTSRNGLNAHKRKYHKDDSEIFEHPYVCSLCEKSFQFQSELKLHEQNHFLPELIKCTECDKHFKSHNGIYMHKKKHHKNDIKENENLEHFATIGSKE